VSYQSLKVGDLIIDFSEIHVIQKIEDNRVFYKSIIEDKSKGSITSSIPLANFPKARLRPIFTKTEIAQFLKNLSHQVALEIPNYSNKSNNLNSLKEYLYLNDPLKTGQLLIYLNERQNTPLYTKSDQIIFDQGLHHLSEEISVSSNISIEEAQKQVLKAIKKSV
jgi:RNA polymerase-interacting CarD/CdnL/TRCF family regulator